MTPRATRLPSPARAAAALALVLTVAGCGLPSDGVARAVDPSTVPYALLSPPDRDGPAGGVTAETKTSSGTHAVAFTSDAGLVLVPRYSASTDPVTVEQDLLDALVAGPTDVELRDGLGSALPPSLRLVAVQARDGTLTVDVTGYTSGTPTDQVTTQVAQIVLTVTSLPAVQAVILVRDGEPIPVPRADGVSTTAPLTARTFEHLVASAKPG